MRFLSSIAALAAVADLTFCNHIKPRTNFKIKETHTAPFGWRKAGIASSKHVINLQIGLTQGNFDGLERTLYEVSTPSHPSYGKHLSSAEVHDLIKPSDEALEAVHEWLSDNDVDVAKLTYSPAKDWIKVSLPVAQVERLLDTKYHYFDHDDGDRLVRTSHWSLPEHLHEHIAAIQPTTSLFRPNRRSKGKGPMFHETFPMEDAPKWHEPENYSGGIYSASHIAATEAACGNFSLVTPDCIRTLYGTINYTVQDPSQNFMALNDFLGEVNIRSDAELYLEKFRPDAVAAAFEFSQISVAGGTTAQVLNSTLLEDQTGIEGNLDAQTMLGIAWPVPLVVYSTGGVNPTYIEDAFTGPTDTDEPYLTWLNYILSLEDGALPHVISTSYDDDEQTVPISYAIQACNLFAQLGARGVTVLMASGDEGVGADGYCISNNGTNATTFLPEWPSTCPFVTSVGATTGFNPEVAAYDPRFSTPFTSGAGFSNYFARPSYQDPYVPDYLSKYVNSTYAGLYNPNGRAIPDLAATSQNFSTVWNGSVVPVDGTSAATPTIGGILALVNDALVAAGKSPLGFLNPLLYSSLKYSFNDITIGSSAGCNTSGFPAAPGWDAVTGWGTPYFPSILESLGVGQAY